MAWFDRFRSIKSIKKEQDELRASIEELNEKYAAALRENERLMAEYNENTRQIEELRVQIETHHN